MIIFNKITQYIIETTGRKKKNMFIFTYYIVRDDEIILRPQKSDIVFKEDKKLSALSFHSANFKICCLA